MIQYKQSNRWEHIDRETGRNTSTARPVVPPEKLLEIDREGLQTRKKEVAAIIAGENTPEEETKLLESVGVFHSILKKYWRDSYPVEYAEDILHNSRQAYLANRLKGKSWEYSWGCAYHAAFHMWLQIVKKHDKNYREPLPEILSLDEVTIETEPEDTGLSLDDVLRYYCKTSREKTVWLLYYQGYTVREIAQGSKGQGQRIEGLGISRSQVCNIVNKVRERIRKEQ